MAGGGCWTTIDEDGIAWLVWMRPEAGCWLKCTGPARRGGVLSLYLANSREETGHWRSGSKAVDDEMDLASLMNPHDMHKRKQTYAGRYRYQIKATHELRFHDVELAFLPMVDSEANRSDTASFILPLFTPTMLRLDSLPFHTAIVPCPLLKPP